MKSLGRKCAQHLLPSCYKWRCSNSSVWWKFLNFGCTLFLGVFTRQKWGGGVPRFQETITSHWSWLPASLIQRQKESLLDPMHCWVGWIEPMLILRGCGSHHIRLEQTGEVQTTLYASTSAKFKCFLSLYCSVPSSWVWVLFKAPWYWWCPLRPPCFLDQITI